MENTRKGFTLVELLAVIVILAIIMIIAIPSVLGTMTIARKKSFVEYVTKVYMAAQNKYMSAQTLGQKNLGSSLIGTYHREYFYIYNIKTDLGLENTGDYKGYVIVEKPNSTDRNKPRFYVCLCDSDFALIEGTNPFYYYDKEPDSETNIVDVFSEFKDTINTFESLASAGGVIDLEGFVNEPVNYND